MAQFFPDDQLLFYGLNPVREALRSRYRPTEVLIEQDKSNPRLADIAKLAQALAVPVRQVPRLDALCGRGVVHQGVAAHLKYRELCADFNAAAITASRYVMFDGINDPHNFGAALRVAEVFGFHDIIFYKGNSSGITPAAIKVSTGAVFHLNVYVSNLNNAIKRLKDAGVAIIAMDGEAPTSLYTTELPERYCIVVGAEDEGVRFAIKRQADLLLRIPTLGKVSSLNVSCALSATLGECARQAAVKSS